jgi:hypothetical protein
MSTSIWQRTRKFMHKPQTRKSAFIAIVSRVKDVNACRRNRRLNSHTRRLEAAQQNPAHGKPGNSVTGEALTRSIVDLYLELRTWGIPDVSTKRRWVDNHEVLLGSVCGVVLGLSILLAGLEEIRM